jgi:hypothetical protein
MDRMIETVERRQHRLTHSPLDADFDVVVWRSDLDHRLWAIRGFRSSCMQDG